MRWNIFVLQKLHGWTDGYNGHNACPPTHGNRGLRIHISLSLLVISLWKVVHFWTMSLNSLPCCSLRNKIIHMSSRQHRRPSDYVVLEEERPVGFERGTFFFCDCRYGNKILHDWQQQRPKLELVRPQRTSKKLRKFCLALAFILPPFCACVCVWMFYLLR